MVLGAVVHPERSQVLLPSGPEFVANSDGSAKNDCERNAIRRYLQRFRREHPKLQVVVMDALHANEPMARMLQELGMSFVIVAKETSQATVYANFRSYQRGWFADRSPNGRMTSRQVSWARNLPLTQRTDAVRVNMVMTEEVQAKKLDSDGQPKQSTWGFITDLEVSSETAAEIARIGRSRWKIENEVFKTLKSDEGVRLGRNYGHGRKHLMDGLTLCMLMAFQFDQLQAIGSTEFQEARARKQGRLSYLWRTMAAKVREVPLESWSMFFGLIGHPERYLLSVSLAPPDS